VAQCIIAGKAEEAKAFRTRVSPLPRAVDEDLARARGLVGSVLDAREVRDGA